MASVALVTGASRGAGKGIARALAARGYTVYITGRSLDRTDAAVGGTLTQTVGGILRVSFPAPKLFVGTVAPVTFSSLLPQRGTVSKSFVLSTEGTIDVTLNSIGNSPNTVMGLGLGVVASDNTVCTLTTIIRTKPGTTPQLSARADAGPYCAAVIDDGNLTAATNFTMTIAHP